MIRRAFLTAAAIVSGSLILGHSQAYSQPESRTYAGLLAKYVAPGPNGVNLVNYAKWKSSKADLKRLSGYLSYLQSLKPSAMSRGQAFAFWVNLYNAATLKVVLDNYPVKSIRDIKSTGTSLLDFKAFIGPWRTKLATVEGKDLSLDDIEHGILRPRFKDPRVHYAVNCASLGCPNLKLTPWTAEKLDADLNAATAAFINHPQGVKVHPGGKLTVSSIYIWFQEDFGGSEQGVLEHLRKYARPPLAQKLRGKAAIASDNYDWTLNDAKNAGRES